MYIGKNGKRTSQKLAFEMPGLLKSPQQVLQEQQNIAQTASTGAGRGRPQSANNTQPPPTTTPPPPSITNTTTSTPSIKGFGNTPTPSSSIKESSNKMLEDKFSITFGHLLGKMAAVNQRRPINTLQGGFGGRIPRMAPFRPPTQNIRQNQTNSIRSNNGNRSINRANVNQSYQGPRNVRYNINPIMNNNMVMSRGYDQPNPYVNNNLQQNNPNKNLTNPSLPEKNIDDLPNQEMPKRVTEQYNPDPYNIGGRAPSKPNLMNDSAEGKSPGNTAAPNLLGD